MKAETRKTELFTVEGHIGGMTRGGFYLNVWGQSKDVFIPRSLVQDSDTELDDVEVGDEIALEIPLWLARDRGLTD